MTTAKGPKRIRRKKRRRIIKYWTLTLEDKYNIELTLILLTWTKWWAPTSASKWRMGFNSAFNIVTLHSHIANFDTIQIYW
jgi:hypothetical protein